MMLIQFLYVIQEYTDGLRGGNVLFHLLVKKENCTHDCYYKMETAQNAPLPVNQHTCGVPPGVFQYTMCSPTIMLYRHFMSTCNYNTGIKRQNGFVAIKRQVTVSRTHQLKKFTMLIAVLLR